MFESLLIRNFQRHKKIEVVFDEHITTIVGSTDAGKSAIIRALRWACLNQPSGESFIQHDSTYTRVTLTFDEGKTIIRRRKKKGNFIPFSIVYSGNRYDYKAVGKGNVPDEISIPLCVSATNFQSQFDSPFWLSDSGGRISQELNRIVDLSIIDRSLASISHEVRKSKSSIDAFDTIVLDAEKEARKTKWAVKANESLERITVINEKLEKTQETKNSLISLTTKIKKLKRYRVSLKKVISKGREVVNKGNELKQIIDKKEHLLKSIKNIKRQQELIESLKTKIDLINKELSSVKRCLTCGKIL